MLEIIVSLRRTQGDGEIGGAENSVRKVGDILVAKKSPAVWGSDEKKFFLITYLKDDDLENSMPHDTLSYPYVVKNEKKAIINRSKYKVNLDMFEDSPGLDPEDTTSEPVKPNGKDYLELSDLIFDDSARQ
jgi:hypothetical protein